MPSVNVACLGRPGYASAIAKKGSESDIAFYDLKRGGTMLTLIEPLRYPERLAPLFYACSMSNFALLAVEELDHRLGEALVMLDRLGVERGIIVPLNHIQEEQVRPLLQGTVCESYRFFEDDPALIREELLQEASTKPSEGADCGSVTVDECFNVKGVGTVVLGEVMSGSVRKHSKLTVHPLREVVVVRSIQMHDDDCEAAHEGDRVGLALRGVDSGRLTRGMVLSDDPRMMLSQELVAELEKSRFWRTPINEGAVLHLGHWMQSVPFRVISAEGEEESPLLTLRADESVTHPPGDRAAVMHLEGGKLRVVGRLRLPSR